MRSTRIHQARQAAVHRARHHLRNTVLVVLLLAALWCWGEAHADQPHNPPALTAQHH